MPPTAEVGEATWTEEVRRRLVRGAGFFSDESARKVELLLNDDAVSRECGHYMALLLSGADTRDTAALMRRLTPRAVEVLVLATAGFLHRDQRSAPPPGLLGSYEV